MGAHYWPPDPPCADAVICRGCCERREREAVAAERARIAAEVWLEITHYTVHGKDPFAALTRLLRVVEGDT